MLQRSRFAAGVLATILLGATPAHAQEQPSGWLELDAGPAGEVHRLTPGGSADWAVGVQVRGEPAASLEVSLQPGGSDLLRDFLSVELRTCSEPWASGLCGGSQRTLMQRTPLASAEGVRVDLMEPGNSAAERSYVQVTATLAGEVPREVQGSRTQITVGVHGSGDDGGGAGAGNGGGPGGGTGGDGPGSDGSGGGAGISDGGTGPGGHAGTGSFPGNQAGAPSGFLADTGARLGGFALLGFVAVAAGFGLARWRGAAE